MILYYTIYCITLYIACHIVEYCITPQNGGAWYFSIFNRWCFYEIGYMLISLLQYYTCKTLFICKSCVYFTPCYMSCTFLAGLP